MAGCHPGKAMLSRLMLNRTGTLFVALTLALVLSACAGTSDRSMKVTPNNALSADVAQVLVLQLPSGDVTVRPSPDDQLHATTVFYCAEGGDRCRKKSEAAKIHLQSEDKTSTLSFSPGSSYSTRTANINIDIAVPVVEQLVVDMPAGALTVESPTACIRLKLGAGDASIRAPESDVASVDLDTGLGESSLRTSSGQADESRPLLVGSEVNWDKGSGNCDLRGRVRAGSLSVHLID